MFKQVWYKKYRTCLNRKKERLKKQEGVSWENMQKMRKNFFST